MLFQRDSEPIPDWRVRFAAKDAASTDSYRVVNAKGELGFLKVFRPDRLPKDRFDSEGKLLEIAIHESLAHPGIPSFLQQGAVPQGNRPFLLTQLIPGETLHHRLARDFAWSVAPAEFLMRGLLSIIAYLHGLEDPVVHNGLSPESVILDAREGQEERPVIIDFGDARRASDGTPSHPSGNDPFYLPNECLEGAISSPACDVFALGAIYYRVLFGSPPWHAATDGPPERDLRGRLLKARTSRLPLPVHTMGGEIADARVEAVIRKALSPNPQGRFENVAMFLDALREDSRPPVRRSVPSPDQSPGPVVQDARGFAAIGGMEELKRTLTEDVINALRERDRYESFGVSVPNGMLLYGPPGCGKTYLAERFGEELGFAFRKITPGTVANSYIYGTRKIIKNIFDVARREAPCVLFLDEVDALIPSRQDGLHPAYAGDVNEWLAQMSDCGKDSVFLLAATNQPSRIDPAVLRTGRFDKMFYVGTPDQAARKAMFKVHLHRRPVDGNVDCEHLAEMTKGWVSSDIKFLVDEAAREALSSRATGIGMDHLERAVRRNSPSVGRPQIDEFETVRRQFESERSAKTSTSRRIGFDLPGRTEDNEQ